jgi:hypothetical protein
MCFTTVVNTLKHHTLKEKLTTLTDRVLRARCGVPDYPRMREYLVVIASGRRLVPEEMDLLVLAVPDVIEAIGLVPSRGEHIERDLSTDRIGKVQVSELVPQSVHHFFSNLVLLEDIQRSDKLNKSRRAISHEIHILTKSNLSKSFRSSLEQFRPMGDTFSIPLRNSINVPLNGTN